MLHFNTVCIVLSICFVCVLQEKDKHTILSPCKFEFILLKIQPKEIKTFDNF
jgi:hypothetical protein